MRFNTYLSLLVALCWLAGGCQSSAKKKNPEKFAPQASTLRFHLEANRDGTERNFPVLVHRAQSFQVNVERDPFLSEFNVTKAGVVDDALGGFNLFIQFDRKGTWLLEQYTTAHKGRRIAIFSHFAHPTEKGKGEARWLAAPLITKRITDGTFAFTPDASRAEAESIAAGLNKIAKKEQVNNP